MDRTRRYAHALAVFCWLTGAVLADDAGVADSTSVPGMASPSEYCNPSCCNSSDSDAAGCGSFSDLLAGCGCQPSRWTFNAGAVIFNRSRPDPVQIIHPVGSTTTLSSSGDFNFTNVAGVDISATRLMNSGNSWQVRFLGGFDWNANQNYGAAGNFQLGSFSNFGAIGLLANYSTRLNSTEVNWLRPVSDRVTFLAGFRAITLHDQLTYNVAFPAFGALYAWNDNNHLYGGQVGGIFNLWRLEGPLRVTSTMKAGAFGNTANNNFNLLPTTGGSFPGGASGTQASFVGEINVMASYAITSHLGVYGGYQLLWIDRVALAADQAAAATANHTQNAIGINGDLLFNGFTGGLTVTW
jgi:hypothetical protein